MPVEGIFSAFQTTLKGLRTEMKKLEAISENVANSERAPEKNGNVYKRKIVLSKNAKKFKDLDFQDQMNLSLESNGGKHMKSFRELYDIKGKENKDFLNVVELEGEKLVYNPAHPRANAEGYVTLPNINIVEEMV